MSAGGEGFRRFRVVPSEAGQTLTVLLARRLKGTTRDRAAEIIKAGGVYVNKLRIRVPSVTVVAGERITVYPDAADVPRLDPDALVFVHRDPAFVVLDKAHGVAVAQTRDSARGTLAEALRNRLQSEGLRRPYVGLVHRIDQAASGLVLFTVRDVANKSVHRQFVEHTIDRTYRAIVKGVVEESFVVDAPLRSAGPVIRVAQKGDAGAEDARTEFRPLRARAPVAGHTLVEASISTGRTHQIRVHAAHRGHPLRGDTRYGDAVDDGLEPTRMCLHAWRLRFSHPLGGGAVDVRGVLPAWARAAGDDDEGAGG